MIVLLNAGRSPKQVSLPLDAAWGENRTFKDVWSGEEFTARGHRLEDVEAPAREGRALSLTP